MSEAFGSVRDSKTQYKEHVDVGGVGAKRVLLSGFDGVNINDVNIDSNGFISAEIQNETIEQVTGEAHNTYNVAVAGKDGDGNIQPFSVDTLGRIIPAGLNIPSHDYVSLSYTGANLTGVVYKTGGVEIGRAHV